MSDDCGGVESLIYRSSQAEHNSVDIPPKQRLIWVHITSTKWVLSAARIPGGEGVGVADVQVGMYVGSILHTRYMLGA